MEGEHDRISNLHDPLLQHILSFLPTKDAVRTGVLSKRWKDLWISQPYLTFDDNDLTDDQIIGHDQGSNSNRSVRTTKFINFVDKVLLHRGHDKPVIKKLQLSCREGTRGSEFARWFQAVLRDGLEELDLKFGRFCEKPFSCLTPCNSLVTLKLSFGPLSGHQFPESFYFPNLKSMHLNGFILANNFTYQLMKSGKLENLLLYYFMLDFSLARDRVVDSSDDQQEILPDLRSAQFDCPYTFRGSENACLFLKKLVTVVSNAKILNLSVSVMEYLQFETNLPDHLPKFNHLKHLKICLQADHVGVLNYLFRMATNLESFHVEFKQFYNHANHDELIMEQVRSNCSRACLKEIQMSNLNPEIVPQLELVQLFFESAGFLEKIIIELDEIAAMNPFQQCQILMELPRLTHSCVLDVKWNNGSHTFTLFN